MLSYKIKFQIFLVAKYVLFASCSFQSQSDSRVSVVRPFVRPSVRNAVSIHASRVIQASKSSIKIKRQNQASKSSVKIKRQNQA